MHPPSEKKLLVIYVGGTLGMKPDSKGSLAPVPGYFTEVVENMEELSDPQMPNFSVMEFDPILDSSCMGPSDWVNIATEIEKNYYDFDGFLVAMGTDTMAYTASALSFMLQNLGKPVIVTGSQIPFSQAYNDARRNLIVSMIFASLEELHEVCVFFSDRLLRGCRASKVNSFGLEAFDSPNFPPLATVGVNIQERKDLLLPPPRNTLRVHKNMDANVVVIKLVPGFNDEALLSMVNGCSHLKAVVLEMYGTGNMPSKKAAFLEFIEAAERHNVLIVAATQCRKGSAVLDLYAVGAELIRHGVVPAGDMTIEAVATKLAYLFGRGMTQEMVRSRLARSLRGEISPRETYTTNLFSKNCVTARL
mmetsp:Transcript_12027/g.15559  ORF Transcript_12027/g.15559 Transcript_12027/m.15559 type:complete len:362 (+) Transcript_12027:128-1213(+)